MLFKKTFANDDVTFRDGTSIMVAGREFVCAVPDNHENVWAPAGTLRTALLIVTSYRSTPIQCELLGTKQCFVISKAGMKVGAAFG